MTTLEVWPYELLPGDVIVAVEQDPYDGDYVITVEREAGS